MRYRILHTTEYDYGAAVDESYSQARLLPADGGRQRCIERRLHILPTPADYREHDDFYGNRVAWFSHLAPHRSMVVEASSVVETRKIMRW